MFDLLKQPLQGVAVYNPSLLNKEELVGNFVVRQPLLERLLDDIRHEAPGEPPQHHLLLGLRGMGKTMLLHRLRFAIEDDPELDYRWLPLTFPEEQYNISRLSDLWLNCLDALGDMIDALQCTSGAESLDRAIKELRQLPEEKLATRALDLLLEQAQQSNKRLVLLIDNLDLILERLKEEQWAVREVLSSKANLLLIGTSTQAMETFYEYEAAFYDFFQIHELRGLTREEVELLLLRLAKNGNKPDIARLVQEHSERIEPLRILSGGNPRTIVLLYSVLEQGTQGSLRTDLERLLDLCTPFYKARLEALSPQGQQIVDGLAIHWNPISAGELSQKMRLENRIVSSNLSRLVRQGVVEKVPYADPTTRTSSSKAGYQLAERFFNIWYLMRASRRVRRRLLWLVEFLRLMHPPEERLQQAQLLLGQHPLRSSAMTRMRHELGILLAKIDRHPEAEEALRKALEVDPTLALAWCNLGKLLYQTGRKEEAESTFRQVFKLDPRDPSIWFCLALEFGENLGLYGDAIDACRKAIELAPDDGMNWHLLGDLLSKKEVARYKEAADVYHKVIEFYPREGLVWNCLAWVLYKRGGDLAEAEEAARNALELNDKKEHHSSLAHTLATILARRGKWTEAAFYARQFLTGGTPEFFETSWADIVLFFREAVEIGRVPEAIELLDECGLSEQWQPLREALLTLKVGSRVALRALAPEIRHPTEELLVQLAPHWKEEAPSPAPRTKKSRK